MGGVEVDEEQLALVVLGNRAHGRQVLLQLGVILEEKRETKRRKSEDGRRKKIKH